MFSCWYSHTNTPKAFSPLTEYLNKGDKSFRSELASGKSDWGASVCKEATVMEKREWIGGGARTGLNGGRELERGIYSSFSSPCVMT